MIMGNINYENNCKYERILLRDAHLAFRNNCNYINKLAIEISLIDFVEIVALFL